MLTKPNVIEAKARVEATQAEYRRVREIRPYPTLEANDAFDAQLQARIDYHVLVSNECAATLPWPMTRAELEAEINAVTGSKLDFGEGVVKALEASQLTGDQMRRFEARALASNGASRILSEKAWQRVWEVLEARCPVRPDTGTLSPPYAIKHVHLRGLQPA